MIETDVLVVGGGPVGLSLACELGWRGVQCLVAEETDRAFGAEARINLVNIRSMEFCRRWGIEKAIRHGGFPDDYPMTVLFLTSLRGREIARLEYPSMGAQPPLATSPTNRQRIPQMWFEPIFAKAATGFPSVTLRRKLRFERMRETTTGIEAELTDLTTGATETVRARYVAGCDGARSPVRQALGIEMLGEQRLSYSCALYFRAPELWRRHDKGKAIMSVLVDKDGMWANLNAIDGYELWRLSMVGGDSYVDPATIDPQACLRRALGADPDFNCEVLSLIPWVRRAVVAEAYHRGRCFIVGDAAHLLSPTGGFGMNTGVADAVDLGWKLEAALAGWGGGELLPSYTAERRPIGERAVREATINFTNLRDIPRYPWIDDDGSAADDARRALGQQVIATTRREWESDGVQLGYRYDPSPICWDDGSAAPPDDPSIYTQTAKPGSRAPHAWIAPGTSTLDLFGRGFVLLDFGAPAESAVLVKAARQRGVPLAVSRISDPGVTSLYERKLALVRPDGHVAWRADSAPDDPLDLIDVVRGAPPKAAGARG
ncbi:MAG TPA: FAD-dependent monooxygenase [Alphaproteobacteria bacterium]|nr:FAD-dependent monooxygenase [Alphaproteobacteria bacterium]